MPGKKILLIDGHSVAYRAFYAVPNLTAPDGTPTNAIVGFFNILGKVWKEIHPSEVYTAFDLKGPTFRHKMYSEYKADRRPAPDTFKVQVPLLHKALPALGIRIMEREGLEADDLLGSAALYFASRGDEAIVLTSDKDILQVVRPGVTVYRNPKRSEYKIYTPETFTEEYGFAPEQMVDYLALMGDDADNIIGVPGCGKKTAAVLLQTYGTIEGIMEHVEELKPAMKRKFSENYEHAIWNRNLTRIKCDEDLSEFISKPAAVDLETFKAFCRSIGTNRPFDQFSPLVEDLELASDVLPVDAPLFANLLAPEKPQAPATFIPEKAAAVEEVDIADTIQASGTPLSELITSPLLALDMSQEVPHGADPDIGVLMRITAALAAPDGRWWMGTADELVPLLPGAAKVVCADAKAVCAALPVPSVKNLCDIGSAWYLLHPDWRAYDVGRELDMAFGPERALKLLSAYKALEKDVAAQNMTHVMTDIDLPLLPVLVNMERRGIRIMQEQMEDVGHQLEKHIDSVTDEILNAAGVDYINLNSPKQVGELLFEKLHLPPDKKTKTGYSTNVTVLTKLDRDFKHISPVPGLILEHRELQKMLSGFVEPLKASANENDIIKSTFEARVTGTGRLSSRDPNLQNIPAYGEWSKKIRGCLVPAGEGHCFISADYSQIELRVLAHLSGDPSLRRIFASGRDIHTETASLIFGLPSDAVTKELRRNAKTVSFGLIYGMSVFGLAERLGCRRGEAKKIMEAYFEVLPGVRDYLETAKKTAMSEGYSVTAFGRKRSIDEISTGSGTIDHLMRAAVNAPIQGTAADITKIAMCKAAEHFAGTDVRIVLQVHDSIVCECPTDGAQQYAKELANVMETAVELSVPLKTESKIGATLADV